jgi:organic hydroperoxide reductase OsmC/OhrA
VPTRAKEFEYRSSLEEDGSVRAEETDPVALAEAWVPEHLVLIAVAQCVLKSLRFYAREHSVSASAVAKGLVTRRDDGLYALVEVVVTLEVRIEPEPAPDRLADLLARAERGCFVGNSLAAKPAYRWRVNGRGVVRR